MNFPTEHIFRDEFLAAFDSEVKHTTFDPDDWFTAGRGKGEDYDWWMENGAQLAQNFIDWYEANPDFTVWVTPDGIPAIELPFEVLFGQVMVKGYIDLVLEHKKTGTLIVTDIKSGSTKPKNNKQLGIYACAAEKLYGVRPRYGTFFMCRGTGKDEPKTYFQQPADLSGAEHSYEYLSGEFAHLNYGVKFEVFPAAPGESCRRCGVAYACLEVHGEQARELDPNWPKGR